MDKNAFYKYVESRGQSGYGAALLVKEPSETKYSLLIASTSVPSVQGSNDSFEFDLLNSPSKGKIMGKSTLDDKEVEFLLHRDNVYRLEKLKGQTLDFMYFTPDFMGWHFTGTISYRPNDAGADVLMGTYVISPMSADESPIIDASSMVKETLCFANAIPENVKSGTSVDFSVVQNVALVFTVFKYNSQNNSWVGSGETDFTAAGNVITFSTTGLFAIKAIESGNVSNFAPWTTTIRVVSAT